MVTPIIIYFIGLIVCYFLFRDSFRDKDDSWDDVRIGIIFSLLSWFGVLILIISLSLPGKPPKWL